MQLTIFRLMPGYIGGCALRDKYGKAHLLTIAAKGGRTTVERYGSEHMRNLARKSAQKRKENREKEARTIKFWDNTIRRVIPYKPANSRAKKPQFVQIMLDEGI